MILSKTDMSIARHYAGLVEDRELADRIFGIIVAEHRRSIDALEKILCTKERLVDNPMLARSIKRRFPYIAPLNYLQVELIRRHRSGKTDAEIR
jgi:phosphoenolpyruvate carboxylase